MFMKFYKLPAMLTALILLITGTLVSAPAASAYQLTGGYLASGKFSVRISAGSPGVSTAWLHAIDAWNATPTLILISRPVSPTPQIMLTEVTDATVGWDGLSTRYPAKGITQSGILRLNYQFTQVYAQATTDGVAAHEIGHIIGLADLQSGCFLMNGFTHSRCGITKPTSDEVNGAKALYK